VEIKIKLNGKFVSGNIAPDMLLIDFLRDHGCYSVKRGCETSNCGLCTVLMDRLLPEPVGTSRPQDEPIYHYPLPCGNPEQALRFYILPL
jgi:hypothetical protein